jgi:hypothetical protein
VSDKQLSVEESLLVVKDVSFKDPLATKSEALPPMNRQESCSDDLDNQNSDQTKSVEIGVTSSPKK